MTTAMKEQTKALRATLKEIVNVNTTLATCSSSSTSNVATPTTTDATPTTTDARVVSVPPRKGTVSKSRWQSTRKSASNSLAFQNKRSFPTLPAVDLNQPSDSKSRPTSPTLSDFVAPRKQKRESFWLKAQSQLIGEETHNPKLYLFIQHHKVENLVKLPIEAALVFLEETAYVKRAWIKPTTTINEFEVFVLNPVEWLSKLTDPFVHPVYGLRRIIKQSRCVDHNVAGQAVTINVACDAIKKTHPRRLSRGNFAVVTSV